MTMHEYAQTDKPTPHTERVYGGIKITREQSSLAALRTGQNQPSVNQERTLVRNQICWTLILGPQVLFKLLRPLF